ncbi:MAG: hypothetical protein IPG81_25355 [Sandaracinaceae bacterium]|nr:hypothetical protein [Sandaracinaceae bacterium]
MDLNEAWGKGGSRDRGPHQQQALSNDVRADRVQNLNVMNQFGQEKFAILLPIWDRVVSLQTTRSSPLP